MSYEGYVEYLCANGHLRIRNCWDDYDCDENGPFQKPPSKCNCGADFVVRHSVDQTNGDILDDPSTMPMSLEVATPAVIHTCSCGNVHIVEEIRYKVPQRTTP